MGLVVHWWALPGAIAFVVTMALAVLVYRARPDRLQNKLLALLLVVEGTSVGWGTGLMYFNEAQTGQLVTNTFGGAMAPIYLLFLGTLGVPIARPLRTRAARALLVALAFAGPAWVLFGPDRYAWARGLDAMLVVWATAGLFGLVVTVSLFRRAAPGSAARAQAQGYLTAFLVRDAAWASLVAAYVLFRLPGSGILLPATALLVFASLLSYAILQHQLFDIDLRVKWTISRATLAAIFLAAFFVVANVASEFLTGTLGYAIGGVSAGLLLFFLAPLQRLAERVSDKAMPRVRDTHEYRTVRKHEVYRAAVDSALVDGIITEKERDVLATLADQLGLAAGEARGVEREAAGAAPRGSSR